jgi:hypothetical protein
MTFHENCINGAAAGCMIESMDAGSTWRVINGTWGGWGESSGIDMLDSTTWLYVVPFTQPSGIWRTADSGNTWTQVFDKFPLPGVARGKNGALYLPEQQGNVLQSTDNGVTWTSLANSPNASTAVAVVGANIYSTFGDITNRTLGMPYSTAAEANPTQWSQFPSPQMTQGAGRNGLTYDPVHHVLYSTNTLSGFWRVVLN